MKFLVEDYPHQKLVFVQVLKGTTHGVLENSRIFRNHFILLDIPVIYVIRVVEITSLVS